MARPRQVVSGVNAGNAGASTAALDDYQTASPASGATVVMNDTTKNGLLYLTPAGTLLALTVTLPSDANSHLGQIRRLSVTQNITTLTVNGATVPNAPSTLSANGTAGFQKVAAATWMAIP